jgi:hypothetical protein
MLTQIKKKKQAQVFASQSDGCGQHAVGTDGDDTLVG